MSDNSYETKSSHYSIHPNQLHKEKRLINEVKYPLLEGALQISTGISAVIDFEPIVRVFSSNKIISLTESDWCDFIENINIVPDNCKEVDFIETRMEFNNIQLISQLFMDEHHILILICNNNIVYLNDESIRQIMRIKDLINHRLKFLKSLNFRDFYNNTILYMSNNFKDYDKEMYINKLKSICNINTCEQSYCFLDFLEFNRHTILVDIDKCK